MKVLHLVGVLLVSGLVHTATAQLVPPPLTATIANFDDIPLDPNNQLIPFPIVTDHYAPVGLILSGFGQNSGGLFNPSFNPSDVPAISLPNVLYFVSAFPVVTGGLAQSPETLTFYPPVQSVQFDISSLGVDCQGTSIVTAQGFAPGGASLGSTSLEATPTGGTIALTFPSPGAEKVVVTSTHTCGTSGLFLGVEVFSFDNIAFVPVASPASRCAQGIVDAAGKKTKAQQACYGKALQKGLPVDTTCLQKASDAFAKSFTKAQKEGDCLTDADAGTIESTVDTFVAAAVATVTGGAPGPDVCFATKLSAIGKKARNVSKCFSAAAKNGAVADEACAEKAAKSFNTALKHCGTPVQLGPLETLIDQFAIALSRALTVPTTTTTTSTTSTTTTTAPPPLGPHLSFTTTAGTADCTLSPTSDPPLPGPPLSGELDSDTAGTTKITDLGLGCLYIGGGAATVAPSKIPENATTILDSPDSSTLAGSLGTGRADCSKGPAATRHCINNSQVECTSDADCAGIAGGCAFDANCYFGPPIPINGFPSSCVVNTFASDASGTLNLATGDSSVSIQLNSRVFITLGNPTACPICDSGACNYGQNAGNFCTTANGSQTTLDCLPSEGTFVGAIPVNLVPLTTDTVTNTAADGLFCSPQADAGAFGQTAAQAITQHGAAAGDGTDNLPHPATLVSNFCIPATGSLALDNLANLPGPGSLSLPGLAQFTPSSPSGAFLED